jgi:cell wall-associated NlpC family hydrolase
MSFSAAGVAYLATGGLLLYSGIKGATIADTVESVFTGKLNVTDTETISVDNSDSTSPAAATGATATGQQIIGDAMKYNGHKYVYGGPSNPTNGWDCSSFVSYVLGHDLGMLLPGNKTWAAATNNGDDHGPVASDFADTPGFYKVNDSATNNEPGDLLVWSGHVGFGTGSGGMFSAYDVQSGTMASSASAPYPYMGTYRVSASTGSGGGGKMLAV